MSSASPEFRWNFSRWPHGNLQYCIHNLQTVCLCSGYNRQVAVGMNERTGMSHLRLTPNVRQKGEWRGGRQSRPKRQAVILILCLFCVPSLVSGGNTVVAVSQAESRSKHLCSSSVCWLPRCRFCLGRRCPWRRGSGCAPSQADILQGVPDRSIVLPCGACCCHDQGPRWRDEALVLLLWQSIVTSMSTLCRSQLGIGRISTALTWQEA